MQQRSIQFFFRGAVRQLHDVPPTLTVLDWLREQERRTGTREGCAEGDCGACTVVLAEPDGAGLRWRAVNACIRFVASLDGCALFTVEDLEGTDGHLHPVQQAFVDHHASQCGFCTPGFVMSVVALSRTAPGASRQQVSEALSGNLCRCTGYRPILDAAEQALAQARAFVDEEALRVTLQGLRHDEGLAHVSPAGTTLRPATTDELLRLRRDHPDAQVLAGGTDVGLWTTKRHRRFDTVLDLTGVRALAHLTDTPTGLAIGAAVRLADAFDALQAQRPGLKIFLSRFASLPVRNSGTLCGNVANGSPIGDAMPLLVALGATVELGRMDAAGTVHRRTLPVEDFYPGFRQTALAADELVLAVHVPAPSPDERLHAWKVSKRFEQDISAVCLAIRAHVRHGVLHEVRIGAGGVAPVPARARATEAALEGRALDETTLAAAQAALQAEFTPISDLRAPAAYRRQALAGLLHRAMLAGHGEAVLLDDVNALSPVLPA